MAALEKYVLKFRVSLIPCTIGSADIFFFSAAWERIGVNNYAQDNIEQGF